MHSNAPFGRTVLELDRRTVTINTPGMPPQLPHSIPPITAVTFDAGGTLLDPWPSVGAVYAEILAVHGLKGDTEELNRSFATACKTNSTPVGGPTDEPREIAKWKRIVKRTIPPLESTRKFDAVFSDLWETFAHPERWRIRKNTRESIAILRQRGFRTAILSNWDRRLRTLLARFDMLDSFDAIIISSEIGWEKPSPEIFAAAEKQLNTPANRILHVGDSLEHDLKPAIAAGWQCVLLSSQFETDQSSADRINDLQALTSLELAR